MGHKIFFFNFINIIIVIFFTFYFSFFVCLRFKIYKMLDIVTSCNPIQYQGKLMMQT